jgi:hypothetical protein
MVEEDEEEEKETAPEDEEAGGQFSIPMPFEDAVDWLLQVKPEKPQREGRKRKAPPEEGGAGETSGSGS